MLTLKNGLRAILVSDRDEHSLDVLHTPSNVAMDTSDTDKQGDRSPNDNADDEDNEQADMQVIYFDYTSCMRVNYVKNGKQSYNNNITNCPTSTMCL